jgi:hypothetical protein
MEIDKVDVVLFKGEYHRRPTGKRAKKIPLRLFNSYVEARTEYLNLKQELESYFKTPKDKPMVIARNHVREGEVHSFGDDGEVSIKKKAA